MGDNGKENGNYHRVQGLRFRVLGFYRVYNIGFILGYYRG